MFSSAGREGQLGEPTAMARQETNYSCSSDTNGQASAG
jgi:hypothetical protein